MSRQILIVFALGWCSLATLCADEPHSDAAESVGGMIRVLPSGKRPHDARLGELKTLNGHFPFAVPANPAQWYSRAESLRRRVLVATGLWPMPERAPIHATIYGKVQRDGFTVEKVSFESLPGHFVTGLLFRPSDSSLAKRPGVLSPHGHGGRNQAFTDDELATQLNSGGEHFAASGRTPKLARCAQLARMGCVTFIFDMLGYCDSVQIPFEVAHRHADVRPVETESTDDAWVFYSPQADLRLQSVMGLQTFNAIRSLDFLASLPDVDADRLAVTGGSGGGTQSILLGAIDDRIKVSFPNGMVSTSMQGGCYCENCNLLRIGTGNVELAALMAPRPQAMTAANDWTSAMMTDGYPQLKWLYAMVGNADDVHCRPLLQFPHNYNYVTRATMYSWFNRHLSLGLDEPIVEGDFTPLSVAETTVWDDEHRAPTSVGPQHERAICRWWDQQSRTMPGIGMSIAGDNLSEFRSVVGAAWQTMIDGELPIDVRYREVRSQQRGGLNFSMGLVTAPARGVELPVVIIRSESGASATGRVVVWTDGLGKSAILKQLTDSRSLLRQIVAKGDTVLLPDLFEQGEFRDDGVPLDRQRRVDDARAYSAFTLGYNPTLVAHRSSDLLAIIKYAKQVGADQVVMIATGGSASYAALAAAIAGNVVDHAIIDTQGFRFAAIDDWQDANFVPGAVKYGDMPAILALRAPHRLTVIGERDLPVLVEQVFKAAGASKSVDSKANVDANLIEEFHR
ncbi:Acetyl xylan esterase (AXE1) [Rubripirellula tenax]|uniref:Acetyl xylan esterase (AXE1) n=1 Tax=Rubripirellula tenax TaxID=2528015 RepID=A0A5C6F9E5_9BACT|nr:alpha/beta hydrolase family protein [Rubripirellula tenax]TWU57067.1 Acetyl xylan esterase (AXE1) [Rubripirellula tenax]